MARTSRRVIGIGVGEGGSELFLDRERRWAGRGTVRIVDRVVRNSVERVMGRVRAYVCGSAGRRIGRSTL